MQTPAQPLQTALKLSSGASSRLTAKGKTTLKGFMTAACFHRCTCNATADCPRRELGMADLDIGDGLKGKMLTNCARAEIASHRGLRHHGLRQR